MPARRMGWVVERRIVRGVVRMGVGWGHCWEGGCVYGGGRGREMEWKRAGHCLLLVNELELNALLSQ